MPEDAVIWGNGFEPFRPTVENRGFLKIPRNADEWPDKVFPLLAMTLGPPHPGIRYYPKAAPTRIANSNWAARDWVHGFTRYIIECMKGQDPWLNFASTFLENKAAQIKNEYLWWYLDVQRSSDTSEE